MKGYVTIAEAAERSGLSQRQVNKLVLGGTVKAERIGQRVWLVSGASLAHYMANRPRPGRRPKQLRV